MFANKKIESINIKGFDYTHILVDRLMVINEQTVISPYLRNDDILGEIPKFTLLRKDLNSNLWIGCSRDYQSDRTTKIQSYLTHIPNNVKIEKLKDLKYKQNSNESISGFINEVNEGIILFELFDDVNQIKKLNISSKNKYNQHYTPILEIEYNNNFNLIDN